MKFEETESFKKIKRKDYFFKTTTPSLGLTD